MLLAGVTRQRCAVRRLVLCLFLGAVGCDAERNVPTVETVKATLTPQQLEAGDPVVNSIGMVLVPIPAGKFLMGSPESDNGMAVSEGPPREVLIDKPFFLSMTEVTQSQYAKVMQKVPSHFSGDDHPVDSVSHRDAVTFCRLLSRLPEEKAVGRHYRLPTEAEWEYACRAGTTTQYAFGDDASKLDEYAWYYRNSNSRTHPVAQKRCNPWGLYDMHGNVWEWCHDAFDRPENEVSSTGDPDDGAVEQDFYVERGGAFTSPPRYTESAARAGAPPGFRLFSNGFRVAAEVPR